MPHFPERESVLLTELKKKSTEPEDGRIWVVGGKDAQKDLGLQRKTTNAGGHKAAAPSSKPVQQNVDDLLGFSPVKEMQIQSPPNEQIQAWLHKLNLNANGVLYEDNVIQIGIKTEYQGHVGRVALFYGNKLPNVPIEYIVANILSNESVVFTENQSLAQLIEAGSQCQQIFSVECVAAPSAKYLLKISFNVGSSPTSIQLALPIHVGKFITPVTLGATDFFGRWKQIGGAPCEAQVVFKAPNGINVALVKQQLTGLSLQVLGEIDPNPDNLVAAGIFTASSLGKVGCLIRLESNTQHKVYNLT
jgi:AP-2 complex subunit alpha